MSRLAAHLRPSQRLVVFASLTTCGAAAPHRAGNALSSIRYRPFTTTTATAAAGSFSSTPPSVVVVNMADAAAAPTRAHRRPAIFVCDLQEKFRNAIWQFDKIVLTTQKVLRAAQALQIPVYVTTQNSAKLGDTVAELAPHLTDAVCTVDKTYFSMWVPELRRHFEQRQRQLVGEGGGEEEEGPCDVVLVGIESHICITQTALDLVGAGHRVYVLADGVSSCNREEIALAFDRLRAARVIVTTSESWLFECMGDAAIPEFRAVSKIVKDSLQDTKTALGGLLSKI